MQQYRILASISPIARSILCDMEISSRVSQSENTNTYRGMSSLRGSSRIPKPSREEFGTQVARQVTYYRQLHKPQTGLARSIVG